MPRHRIPMSAGVIDAAIEQFSEDRFLAPLVERIEPPLPGGRKDPFASLVIAVFNQQISVAAAAAVERRVAEAFGKPFRPQPFTEATESEIRACGVSASKARCIKVCAEHFLEEGLSAASCRNLSDEQVAERLVGIKGIGRWSAQMVLMFGLGRPDVMPDGDGGIQRSAKMLFRSRTYATAQRRLIVESRRWRPYRSVAAWYLWRQLA